jgi:hypothetical protein
MACTLFKSKLIFCELRLYKISSDNLSSNIFQTSKASGCVISNILTKNILKAWELERSKYALSYVLIVCCSSEIKPLAIAACLKVEYITELKVVRYSNDYP